MKSLKKILKKILKKLFFPPVWALIIVPVVSFAGLILVFTEKEARTFAQNGVFAYAVYALSAYSLAILVIGLPKKLSALKNRISEAVIKKSEKVPVINSYFTDLKFKADVGLWQGALIDFVYVGFKLITGIIYSSWWFITLAGYHAALGLLRVYLITCRRRQKKLAGELSFEYKCYNNVAWLLFLLNIPMTAVMGFMIWKNSGFIYPGYVIYLSAAYTFYRAIISVINVVKFKKEGSPILSCAKVLNFIAAIMSVLGLQTAMLAEFSNGQETFRRIMNAATSCAVTLTVITVAVYMIVKANRFIKTAASSADKQGSGDGAENL